MGRLDLTPLAASETADHERQLLAAELHDGLGQELAGAAMLAAAIERRWDRFNLIDQSDIKHLRAILDSAQTTCRDLAHRKFRGTLPPSQLGDQLQRLARHWSRTGDLTCRYFGPASMPATLTGVMAHNIVRIAQETLSNCVKHSGASEITMMLTIDYSSVRLAISDNGRRRSKVGRSEGIGLSCMYFRVKLLGGTINLTKSYKTGCRVSVTIPLSANSHSESRHQS